MSRILALLLSAVIGVTPVIGAVCADGCFDVDVPVEVVETCGHGDVSDDAPAMSAAACASPQADFVVAEIRTLGPALAPSLSDAITAPVSVRPPAPERYLQHQPPPTPADIILRI